MNKSSKFLILGAGLALLASSASTTTALGGIGYTLTKKEEEDLLEEKRKKKEENRKGLNLTMYTKSNTPLIPKEDQVWRKPFKQSGSKFIPNSKNRR